MPEDDVFATKFLLKTTAVKPHHLRVPRNRDRVVGTELHQPVAPHRVADHLWERVAEYPESLAGCIRARKPATFEIRSATLEPFQPPLCVALFLLDPPRRARANW